MNNAYFHEIESAGLVIIVGETRKDYLQRQSSNDLSLLNPTSALPNILTAPTGKILEIFTMIDDSSGYLLTTPANRGRSLSAYFKERVFFNDQVEISDNSSDWIQFKLVGSKWVEIFAKLFNTEISSEPNSFSVGKIEKWDIKIFAEKGFGGEPNFLLLAPLHAGKSLISLFEESGALPLGEKDLEAMRIEASAPGPGEFFGKFTPFEIGLYDRVSASKGCYTGQEVLARQITYDKITRTLVQLKADGRVSVGMVVLGDGKIVGKVTSAVPTENGSLALAVVKKPFNGPGTSIKLKDHEQEMLAKILPPSQ